MKLVTLDILGTQHGMPVFMKTEVEGFEDKVLAGMSTMPPALCFEVNSEALDIAEQCIDIVRDKGAAMFCLREGIGTASGPVQWHSRDDVVKLLRSASSRGRGWYGDVFAAREAPSDVGAEQRK